MKYRKLFAALSLAFIFASCGTQTNPVEPVVTPAYEQLIEFHINASCVNTKTVNDGMATKWEKGDAIVAIYRSGGQAKSAKFINEGGNSFTGEISEPDQPCDWYAFYPYSADIKDPTAINVNIPCSSVQSGYGSMAHLAGINFPLYGKAAKISGEPDIPMSQLASVCCFNVTNGYDKPVVITGIDFTAPGAICGSYTANISGDTAELATVSTANITTLKIDGGGELANGETAEFYLGMAPFAYNGEYTIRIDATCNGKPIYSEKTVSTAMEFKSGAINTIPYKFKKTGDATVKAYVKVTEDPGQENWAGKYLVVNTEGTKAFAAFAGNASTYAVDVTVEDNKIASTPEIDAYALTITGGTDNHGNLSGKKAYDVKNSDGKYIFFSNGNLRIQDNNKNIGNNNTEYTYRHAFSYDENGVQMISSGTTNGQSKYYHTFVDGAFIYQKDQTTNRVQLYKLIEEEPVGPVVPPQDQTLTFESSSIEVTIGEEGGLKLGDIIDAQSVSGVKTTVAYTSSDTEVAEIVDGCRVKINSKGQATITATAAATEFWKAASASYTLTIKEHGVVPETDLGTFNLESNALSQYLDATTHYTDDNWKTVTVITSSPFSSMCGVGGEGYDFPTPVTISWSGNNRQNVNVSIYSDSSRSESSLDQTASSTSTSVKFYNLIPGRTYYYTVALGDGTELDRGYFNTTGRRRQIKTTNTASEDYATNVRDLGGMVTTDGKTLNYGIIYRGSNMRMIGNAEKAIIRDYMKVRLDVDLRQDEEWTVKAGPVFPESEVAYSHVAYYGESMTDFLNKSKVNKTFTDIISYVSQGKAIYIHCKSGADRTGYVCMLIEAVCGVSLADCTKDYEITSFSKAGSRDRCGQKNAYLFQKALDHVLAAEGSTFQQKAINVLKTDGGITDAQIKALQDAMIQK